jgi:hypothetical protein
VGAETDAARAEVLASRAALLDEVQRLEASARAAVDIPAKVRRAPARTAGLAAGTAFVVLGGPQRLYRRARRAILGPKADMPKSLLPKDVEKTGFEIAAWTAEELATADEAARGVIRGILAGEFWPPADPPPDSFNDFAAICQDDLFAAAAISADAGEDSP